MQKTNSAAQGILFTVSGYSAFAIGDSIAKYMGGFYSTLTTIFYMNLFLVLFLAALSPFLGGLNATLRTKHFGTHVLRGLLFAAGLFLFVYALQKIPLAKAYTVLFTMPFLSTLLAMPLLKESADGKRWASIAIGFSGVLVVLRPGVIMPEPAAFGVLLAAFLFALFDIMTRKIGQTEAWITFAFFPAVTIVVTSGILLTLQKDFVMPAHLLLFLLALAGAAHMAGSLFTARGYTLAPISLVSPFQYIQLLWGVLIGYFFFQEIPDLWTAVGSIIIVGSGIFLIRHQSKTA